VVPFSIVKILPAGSQLEYQKHALDERLGKMRARMLADTALASAATEMTRSEGGEGWRCPACGKELEMRGKQEGLLTSQYNQTVRIERRYGVCPQCEAGFFPSG